MRDGPGLWRLPKPDAGSSGESESSGPQFSNRDPERASLLFEARPDTQDADGTDDASPARSASLVPDLEDLGQLAGVHVQGGFGASEE